MFRQVAQRLACTARRGLSTSAISREGEKGPEEFIKKFTPHVSSTLAPPHFPSEFLPKEQAAEEGAGVPEKLTLNFFLPHETTIKDSKVDLVLLPALTGDFGVMPGHVPTVAQLRPGVVTVHKTMDKEIEKYFVSSGFAFVHADSSTDVCAVEAVKVEDLDPEAVRAGLQEYTAKLGALQAKGDDYEIAAAQIGVEMYSAMNAAVGA
ncbi:g7892 [Coccomyxa elongata]